MPETFSARSGLDLGEGTEFVNGETCKGISYPILTPEGDVDTTRDFASIEVVKRYPASGLEYSQNNGSDEFVTITGGEGYLLKLKTSGYMSRIALKEGSRVLIRRGEAFAWWQTEWDETKQPLAFDMVCSPPFDPAQYTHVEHDEYVGSSKKRDEQ